MAVSVHEPPPSSLSSSPPRSLSFFSNNNYAAPANLQQVHVVHVAAAGNGAPGIESLAARGGGGGLQTAATAEPEAVAMLGGGGGGGRAGGGGGAPIPLIRANGITMALASGAKHSQYPSSPTVVVPGSRFAVSDTLKSPSAAETSVAGARARLTRLMDMLLKIVAVMLLGIFLLHVLFDQSQLGVGGDDSLSSTKGIPHLGDSAAVGTSASTSAASKPRVLIVSASQSECGTEKGDNDILKSLKNKADYARRHRMDTWFSMELLVEPQFHRLRNKIVLLKKILLTEPNYDWYMWIDSDAMFTDMSFEIPWERYRDRSVVIFGNEKSLDTDPDYHESINMGVALLRNDAFTRALLDRMVDFWAENSNQTELTAKVSRRIKRLPPYVCDQGTALYLLLTEPEKWRRGFFFELNYGLNRYWKEVAPHLEKYDEGVVDADDGGPTWKGDGLSPPFITHFCGCSLCWKKVFDDFEECQRQYERAFTFANNQVIKPLGVKHRNLTSPEVVSLSAQ
ncbi:hypothetical protein CBR_g19506 [Chara braunii]|uniref:GT34-family glycosyltransferase n=1 Tax=Chara braunii TaxID=69332 RepID=A0A388KYH2_CHABU|nr:hypothetical protein CBR_g19506 [Chara braunii]|eukprot:GBG74993.1 hypothetical protein CBR_g19506 [Chara braunii]